MKWFNKLFLKVLCIVAICQMCLFAQLAERYRDLYHAETAKGLRITAMSEAVPDVALKPLELPTRHSVQAVAYIPGRKPIHD